MQTSRDRPGGGFIADGHAHIYPVFHLGRFFDVALGRAAAAGKPLMLALTESSGHDYFAALRGRARGERPREDESPNLRRFSGAGLSVRPTGEPESLVATGDRGAPPIFLVAGRQIVSAERLEVQAVGLPPETPAARVEDGAVPAERLLSRLLDAGGAAVLPWGVGKWTGARGREVARLVALPSLRDHPLFFVADIAARCWPWPEPAPFRSGVRVLAGSDVLPLPGAESGLAAYGFRLAGPLDPSRPAASLLDSLRAARVIERIGRRLPLPAVALQQVRHRLRPRTSP